MSANQTFETQNEGKKEENEVEVEADAKAEPEEEVYEFKPLRQSARNKMTSIQIPRSKNSAFGVSVAEMNRLKDEQLQQAKISRPAPLQKVNSEKLKKAMMKRINAFQTNLQQNIDQLQALARQERQTGKKDMKEFKNVFASFRHVVSDSKRL